MIIEAFMAKSISQGFPSDIYLMMEVRLLFPGDKSENKEKKKLFQVKVKESDLFFIISIVKSSCNK